MKMNILSANSRLVFSAFLLVAGISATAGDGHTRNKVATGNRKIGTATALSPQSPASPLVKIDTRLYSLAGNSSAIVDANVVVFNEQYSNAVDQEDAFKFPNSGENIGIKKESRILVVEGRQPLSGRDTIFFQMWNMRVQQYRLEILPQNMAPGVTGNLEDTYLNTCTPLSMTSSTLLNFSITNTASASPTRFRLVFQSPIVLATTFTGINAARVSNEVKLQWQVTAERDMQQYIVERSEDGRVFKPAGTVAPASAGNYGYQWIDQAPAGGIGYYRIKAVSLSGLVQYSSIVKINGVQGSPKFNIYPNPVTGAVLNLQVNNAATGNYRLKLGNKSGQVLMETSISHPGGNVVRSVQLPGSIAPGIYQLQISNAAGESTILQVMIY